MNANAYHFITRWRVPGTVEEVADVLADASDLPRWWPAVYLEVEETKPGDDEGIGKEVSLYTKGWLPYTLRWQFRVTESSYPHGFALEAWGDFAGRGEWMLRRNGCYVEVTYDWRVRAEKPLLRRLSFLLRPLFAANHRWSMARGEESLRLELARRAATGEDEQRRIPPPPGPTSARTFVSLVVGALLLLVPAGAVWRRLRQSGSPAGFFNSLEPFTTHKRVISTVFTLRSRCHLPFSLPTLSQTLVFNNWGLDTPPRACLFFSVLSVCSVVHPGSGPIPPGAPPDNP